MSESVPKLVCFSCNFGWGYLADRQTLAAQVKNWIPVACSGKVEGTQVLQAFAQGADGVLILGCPERSCHFQDGNHQAKKRTLLLQRVLQAHGIEPARLQAVFSLDPEGETIPGHLEMLAATIRDIGSVTSPAEAVKGDTRHV